ncbi:helix-turn-helix transcriptional regulator [Xanthomonas arboricola]|uniref:helix-turn-helix transcriptional regulator n=1 Tax=Xanthomonas arboricola TaxID=56448 RepID=UPI000E1F63EC|nr:helix-turn-helix transcriptional regulator [Xanthomonas arboricola]
MNTSSVLPAAVALSKERDRLFRTDGCAHRATAQLRKDQSITQAQLAQWLGVSQQTITAYKVGRRRIQVSALPTIARALGVSVEELIGEPVTTAKRGPAPKLQQQLERITRLPKAQQRFVMQMIDTVLQQQAAGR